MTAGGASLTGVHLLLTYACTLECDHCFVYSGPYADGTMTLAEIRSVLEQARSLGSVAWIFFEGGEPFLFHPTLLEGVALARRMGFRVGVVSNGHGAVSAEDAEAWLRPLAELGLDSLTVSLDALHGSEGEGGQAMQALAAAGRLGIPRSARRGIPETGGPATGSAAT
jgi:MoaA/NifB/PqqE/SkfB family radical SAM enzyme